MPPEQILGREDEIAAVDTFLSGAVAGPAALVLEGDAGIGKTTLWRAAVELARERSYRVLSCSPAEAERQLSFAALGDLVEESVDDFLPTLPPPQARALEVALRRAEPDGPTPDPLTIGVALLAGIRALADRPVLIAVDDVQWLDPPSASALAFVARRLRTESVTFLLASRRPAPGGAPLGLDRAHPELRVSRLEIGPLSLGAVHRLLRLRLAAVLPRPTLLVLHEASGGNPFFALELGRALLRGEIDAGPDKRLPVPNNLRGFVRERLAGLHEQTRDVLLVAAALSQPSLRLLEAVVGGDAAASALEEARAAGVLEMDRCTVRFVHPLLASACYSDVAPAKRRSAHRDLAEAVFDPEERVRHLALAAEGPDEAAAAALESAAENLGRRGAPQSAAQLLELAIELTPAHYDTELRRRKSEAGDYHFVCGDVARARRVLEEASVQAPTGPERAGILIRLAQTMRDDVESGIAVCEQALVEAEGDARQLAQVHHLLAHFWAGRGSTRTSLQHARRAVDFAERTGDATLLASALTRAAAHEYRGGRSEQALALLARALALKSSGASVAVYWGPDLTLARILFYQGRFDEARQRFDELLDAVATSGDERSRLRVLTYLAELEWGTGDLAAAAERAAEALELAEQIDLDPLSLAEALRQKAFVDAYAGRVAAARHAANRVLELARSSKAEEPQIDALAVLGFVDLSQGDTSSAARHLRRALAMKRREGWRAPTMLPIWENTIEALLGSGETNEARATVAEYEQLAREYDSPPALALAVRCRGLVSASSGDLDGAFVAFDRALALHEAASNPVEQARTLLAYGATLRRSKRRRAARERLELALSEFERLGTPLWAEKARAELARVGGRAPRSGELSESERRIAELVAEGRSNKEVAAALFLTPKTVETKLSRIYAKLGIHSRGELANCVLSGGKSVGVSRLSGPSTSP